MSGAGWPVRDDAEPLRKGLNRLCFKSRESCREPAEDGSKSSPASRESRIAFGINLAALCAAIAWVCWPSLLRMQSTWSHQPQYSHGYLVPLFAGFLLWHRRAELLDGGLRPSLIGLPVLAAGLVLKWVGTAYFVDYIDDVAVVVLLIGAALTAGGLRGGAWAWQGFAFLLFMVPLPFRLETGLQQALLRVATASSTYALQTLGYAAIAEGNVIHLPQSELGVLDACSGLRMGIVCTAMAALAGLVSTGPLLKRAVLFASGLPLAVVVNITRIAAMGMISEAFGQETAKSLFHDASGFVMALLALGLLLLELRWLTWVFNAPAVVDENRQPMFAH